MTTAEWLLRHHLEHQSRLRLLDADLKKLEDGLHATREKEELISDLSLHMPAMDGMPHSKTAASKTERIALTYEERYQTDTKEKCRTIRIEINELQYYMRIYEIMMSGLTEKEKWLITKRYVEQKSYGQMLVGMPPQIDIQSKSTLAKKCCAILERINKMFDGISVRRITGE